MDISTGDDVVALIPFNESFLKEAVLLYNSSDMCFATGFADKVSEARLALMLDQVCSQENEFVSCIFIKSDSGTADVSGKQLVGIVSGVLQGNELWIKLLAILPSFRNAGIGTRSIGLIIGHFAKSFNAINVFVSVVEDNKGGLRFWTRQGFSVTGVLNKELFGENRKYKVAIMNKRL